MPKPKIEKTIIISVLFLGAFLLFIAFIGKKEAVGFIGTVLLLAAAGYVAFTLKE